MVLDFLSGFFIQELAILKIKDQTLYKSKILHFPSPFRKLMEKEESKYFPRHADVHFTYLSIPIFGHDKHRKEKTKIFS